MAGTSNGTLGYPGEYKEDWDNSLKTKKEDEELFQGIPSPSDISKSDEDLKKEAEEESQTGLSIYDSALQKKLLEVFPNIIVAHPDVVMKRASEKDGKISLPMISMYRMANPIKEGEINHFEAFHGRAAKRISNDHIELEMALPIEIEYQIDIWAQKRSGADSLFRELVFFLLREPNLVINIPEFERPQIFSMKYESMDQPTDYSSIEESSPIHRYSLTYKVPDARLFYRGVSEKLVRHIPVNLIPVSGTKCQPPKRAGNRFRSEDPLIF